VTRQRNLKKHGVSFDRGVDAIVDPYAVFEDASVPEEERQAAIGLDRLRRNLYVVHVEREGGCLRLISARQASGREVKRYENPA
jgi:uncharacterized DUF497 family protein